MTKSKMFLFNVTVFFLMVFSSSVNATVITIDAVASGRVYNRMDGTTYGDASWIEAYRVDITGFVKHGIAEFTISSIPSGAVINSVELELTQLYANNNGNSDVEILGYVGNGILDAPGDFDAGFGNQLLAPGTLVTLRATPGGTQYSVQLPPTYLQNLVVTSHQFLGLEFVQRGKILLSSVGITFIGNDQRQGLPPKLYIDYSEQPQNVPPVADPGGPYIGAVNTQIDFDGSGSSDSDGDPLTYAWDFGDGGNGTGDIPAHSYGSAGIYDVCLTVNDGTVDSPAACTIAVVYDASAGFVTGGGWIDSPAGAYTADPSLAGKANFGFVSKYKKGAAVPTGNTEFVFQAADLNFHSNSYDWLVVTGSDYARFKGTGTINGDGPYKFMLWAGDGAPDTFRIKIWKEDEATGDENVIYDNDMDQPIGGGSIVIHTK